MFQSKKAEIETIKKRGLKLRLRFLRYRQTPCTHIRVKAHAKGVSINFYSCVLLQICRFSESKNKANAFLYYMSFVCFVT